MTNTRTRTTEHDTPNLADQAAETANAAIRSTQDMANATFDRISDRVDEARDRAAPAIDRWSAQADNALHRSLDALRDTTNQLREQVTKATDVTAGRVRDEPLKSVLIAAAAGAALMVLLNLFSGNRRDRR
jgi:ElaB/YqjD/DUF883 family membrane-anchored ribosome-binding protein